MKSPETYGIVEMLPDDSREYLPATVTTLMARCREYAVRDGYEPVGDAWAKLLPPTPPYRYPRWDGGVIEGKSWSTVCVYVPVAHKHKYVVLHETDMGHVYCECGERRP